MTPRSTFTLALLHITPPLLVFLRVCSLVPDDTFPSFHDHTSHSVTSLVFYPITILCLQGNVRRFHGFRSKTPLSFNFFYSCCNFWKTRLVENFQDVVHTLLHNTLITESWIHPGIEESTRLAYTGLFQGMISSFFLGIDWFDYWVLGLYYQSIW